MKKLLPLLCTVVTLTGASRAHAASVTSLADNGSGSLRDAIAAAAPGETITFAVTGTIVLTNGQLTLNQNGLTLAGPGTASLTVQRDTAPGTPEFRIFNVISNNVVIAGLTVNNGRDLSGGGIRNEGSLILSNVVVTGNAATNRTGFDGFGGGIYNTNGSMILFNTTVSTNAADGGAFAGFGGGIYNVGTLSNFFGVVNGNTASGATGAFGGGVYNAQTLRLDDGVVDGNLATGGDGAVGAASQGGGIHNNRDGSLVLFDSSVSHNSARAGAGAGGAGGDSAGGGVFNLGDLVTQRSRISANTAAAGAGTGGDGGKAEGGGVATTYGGIDLLNSTLDGNSAVGGASVGGFGGLAEGGGLASEFGDIVMIGTTLSGNSARGGAGATGGLGQGGAVANESGSVYATNSSFSGNSVAGGGGATAGENHGGAFANGGFGYVGLFHATVVSNSVAVASALDGGGIFSFDADSELYDTIFTANAATFDAVHSGFSALYSDGHNLIGTTNDAVVTGSGDQYNVSGAALALGPLQNNGGSTHTHALLCGSIAINAGDNADAPATDQRGFVRIVGGVIDIGAFEAVVSGGTPALAVTKFCPTNPVAPGGLLVFSGTVSNAGDVALTGIVIVNDRPGPDTFVTNFGSLDPGQSTNFTGGYTVPFDHVGCSITDTLIASAVEGCANTTITATNSATCPVAHTLTFACPSGVNVQCLTEVPAPDTNAVIASSTAGGVAVVHLGDTFATNGCEITITRGYAVTDSCGNSTSCVQTITVRDTTPPSIACSSNLVFSADAGQCSKSNVTFTATASDGCGGVTVSCAPPSGSTFPHGVSPVTCVATDSCTNTNACVFTVTVLDTTAPVLVGVPDGTNYQCQSDVPAPATVTATDDCDTNVTVTLISTTNGLCPTVIVHCWTATDTSSNSASACQTNTVLDTIPPTLVGVPANTNYQCLGDVPVPAAVTAMDNCDSNVIITLVTTTNGTCPTLVVHQWTATDACSNSVVAWQTNTVLDTMPPVLAGVPSGVTVQCLADVPPANVTATDNCGGATVTLATATNGSCPTLITRTWTATDACTNRATASQIITVQPALAATAPTNLTVCPGADATFCTTASGDCAVTFQWFKGGAPIAGATNSCFTIRNATAADAGACTVVARGACQSVTNSATLTLLTNTTATTLTSQTVCPGSAVTFSTTAGGTGPFTFQWLKNNSPIAGATSNCLTLAGVTAADAGVYCVNVTGACGTAKPFATLTVLTNTTAVGPLDEMPCPGTDLALCTMAFGSGPFRYQWFKGTNLLAGQTNCCLALLSVKANDSGDYCVKVTGACNSVTNYTHVSVLTPLTISRLTNTTACLGGTVALCTTVSGSGPHAFQWFKNGALVPGVTGNCLTLTNVTPASAAEYCVTVTGPCNSATSCARLSVVTNTTAVGPEDATVCAGGEVSLCTTAAGTGTFRYQWFKGANPLAGATNDCLFLPSAQTADSGGYCVVATGFCNSVTNCATVIVLPPTTATPVADQSACLGTNVTFCTTAGGAGPFAFQWFKSGALIAGATNSCFTVSNVTANSAGTYLVQVVGACGFVVRSARLTVLNDTFAFGPDDETVCAGRPVTLCTLAFGLGPFSYQWFKNGQPLAGEPNNCLSISAAMEADAGAYCVVVAGFCNTVTNCATLNVQNEVTATTPANQTVCPGANVTFCTTAAGGGPLAIQWYKGAALIPGATGNCLTLSNVTAASAGLYRVVVSGPCGVVARTATLTVLTNTTAIGPDDEQVCAGQPVQLCTIPAGTGPFTFQWFKGTNSLALQTNICLNLGNVTVASAGSYSVRVTGACGVVTNTASVVVRAPTTVAALTDQTACPGGGASFCATVTGPAMLQWFMDGMPLAGQTNACLNLSNITFASAAEYCVVVSGPCNTEIRCATLTVQSNTAAFGPADQVACAGEPVKLCAIPSGTGPFTYQWFKGAAPLAGQTGACLDLGNATAATAGNYCVRVTGACGSVTNCATVIVRPLVAATPLTNAAVCPGGSASFCTTVTGPATLQWYMNGMPLPGETNRCLTVSNAPPASAGEYCVIVSGPCNTVTLCATLGVMPGTTALGPASRTVCAGEPVKLCAIPSGASPFTYQWFNGPTPLAGQTGACLDLGAATAATAGNYCVRVTGACGSVTNCATVTVRPRVAATPLTNVTACAGGSAVFCSTAAGATNLQWFMNGMPLAGRTGQCLALTSVTPADAGEYCLIASGPCDTVIRCATLTVGGTIAATPLVSQTACPGGEAKFCTVATGSGPFGYQWSKDGAAIPGATSNCLTILSVTDAAAGDYCVTVTGPCNSVTQCATLTVRAELAVEVLIPLPDCLPLGSDLVICPAISGPAPVACQWLKNGVPLASDTNCCLVVSNYSAANAGQYCLRVTGPCNVAETFITLPEPCPPVIISTGTNVCLGGAVDLCALGTMETSPYTYQWCVNDVPLPGQTNRCLTITNARPEDARIYRVVITGQPYLVVQYFEFTVLPLTTATPLVSQTNAPGTGAVFSTVPGGQPPFTFQWFKDGLLLEGATAGTFSIPNVTGLDAGEYCVKVTGFCGPVTNCARLEVPEPRVPGLELFKAADRATTPPGGAVNYTYTVRNTGGVTLTDVVVVDDNATPGWAGDDFVVCTLASLEPGASALCSVTNIPVVNLCTNMGGSNLVVGTLITDLLPGGDVKVTLRLSRAVVDNTYGANAAPGYLSGHTLDGLVQNDKAQFQFFNGGGTKVLDFYVDYLTKTNAFPSGYGSLGVRGGDGAMLTGASSNVLLATTSLTTNLNQAAAYHGYTTNSPAPEANFPGWDYVASYTVIVKGSVFGASGFSTAAVPFFRNSPVKVNTNLFAPRPCDDCVTNLATVTARAGGSNLVDTATAVVCLETPNPPCVPATITFTGNTGTSGTAGNVRTFTAGGVSVKASGFSRTTNGTWATAYLGSYPNGLGVTDGSEGTGSSDRHVVDNLGRYNYVLFEFNQPVAVSRAYLDYVLGDSDITVWLGTFGDPFNSHLTLSDGLLASFGLTENSDASDGNARWAPFNAGGAFGNALVIAAKPGGSLNDQFKISKLDICQPPVCAPRLVLKTVCPAVPVALGGLLTISGTVSNSGGVPITNLQLFSDRLASNTLVAVIDSLPAGQSAPFSYSFAVPTNYQGCNLTDLLKAEGLGACGTVAVAIATNICPVACRTPGCVFLVMDEDCIDNTNPGCYLPSGAGRAFSASDVNDDIAAVGRRTPLRYFNDPANFGRRIILRSGEVGDEGLFAVKTIPTTWAAAGPTADGMLNFLGRPCQPFPHSVGAGLGAGSDPEAHLDEIPRVTPLRAKGLANLVGLTVCALVYDSDISINYDPLTGSLKGATLGVVAFKIVEVKKAPGFSSGTLPRVTVEIVDPCVAFAGRVDPFLNAPEPQSSSEPFDTNPSGGVYAAGYLATGALAATGGPVGGNASAGSFSLTFETEPNIVYAVEYSADLSGAWLPLIEVLGTGEPAIITDADAGGSARFYRVVTKPFGAATAGP